MESYQLYRVQPNLSGDAKIDVVLSSTSEVPSIYVTPVSNTDYMDLSSKDYIEGKYRKLFDYTRSSFYSNLDFSGNPLINDTFLAGTYRVPYHKYKGTHCTLVPLWLGDIFEHTSRGGEYKLQIRLIFRLPDRSALITKLVDLSNILTDYIRTRSLSHHGIYIDVENNQCTIYGYNPRTSTPIIKKSEELYKELFKKGRPHLETCKILSDYFRNNELILPELINIGIYYDINHIISGLEDLSNGSSFEVDTEVINQTGVLDKRDFYTNFDYVPSFVVGNAETHYIPSPNTLDKLCDYNVEGLKYNNQFIPEYCHWGYMDRDNIIFNTHPGFINVQSNEEFIEEVHKKINQSKNLVYPEDLKKNINSEPYKLSSDDYGDVRGNYDDRFNEQGNNTQWAGKLLYGGSKEIFDVLINPQDFIDQGYFRILTQNKQHKTYIGAMTTGMPVDLNNFKTSPHLPGLYEGAIVPYEFKDHNILHRMDPGMTMPRLYYNFYDGYDLWLIWDPGYVGSGERWDKNKYVNRKPDYLTWGKFSGLVRQVIQSIKKPMEQATEMDKYYKDQFRDLLYDHRTKKSGKKTIFNKNNKTGVVESKEISFEVKNFEDINLSILSNNLRVYVFNINNPLYVSNNLEEIYKKSIKYHLRYIPSSTYQIKRPIGYLIPAMTKVDLVKKINNHYQFTNKPGLNFMWTYNDKNGVTKGLQQQLQKMGLFHGSYVQFGRVSSYVFHLQPHLPYPLPSTSEYRWFDHSRIMVLPKRIEKDNLSISQYQELINTPAYQGKYDIKIFHSEYGVDKYKVILELI